MRVRQREPQRGKATSRRRDVSKARKKGASWRVKRSREYLAAAEVQKLIHAVCSGRHRGCSGSRACSTCCHDAGRPLFGELMFGRQRPTYVAFDLLFADGVDLRPLPLRECQARLAVVGKRAEAEGWIALTNGPGRRSVRALPSRGRCRP